MEKNKKIFFILLGILLGAGILLFFSMHEKSMAFKLESADTGFSSADSKISGFAVSGDKVFEADNVLLKLTVKQGELVSKSIKITNSGSVEKEFEISSNLDFALIEEKKFILGSKESKSLAINFETKDKAPGVYVGYVKILSGKEELIMPVIIEIETKEVLFDSSINIPIEYNNIYPRGEMIVENKIFDLENIGPKNIEVQYIIRDFNGKTIFSEQENIAVKNQISDMKTIFIPEGVDNGNYVFITVVKYQDSVGASSYFFKIKKEKSSIIWQNWAYLATIAFLSLLVIFFFMYYIWSRDRLLKELHEQYKNEIKNQREIIKSREKRDYKKLKSKAEKKLYKKQIKRVKKERIKAIKKIHRKRAKEYHKLKKSGEKRKLASQLKKWKSQGYNTEELEKKFRIPSIAEIKEKTKEWKSQGYDTSVLER